MFKKTAKLSAICLVASTITGCFELDVSEDRLNEIGEELAEAAATRAANIYPSDVVMTSPFAITDANTEAIGNRVDSRQRDFNWIRNQLRDLRNNKIPLARVFSHNRLRVAGRNAECFGPELLYQNHPDGTDFTDESGNASLPTGDLGIWSELDEASGNACAAAQLNAKMKGLRYKTFSGMAIFAGMLGKASQSDEFSGLLTDSDIDLDLTQAMNDLDIEHIVFNEASIKYNSEEALWNYSVTIDFRHLESDDPKSATFTMQVKPGSEEELYTGTMNYRLDGRMDGTQCTDNKVERIGSVAFEKSENESVLSQARHTVVCGHDGSNGFDENGVLDPTYSKDQYEDGWVSNFSIFSANFDPDTRAGRYAYTWQAGNGDSHSRIFNITMNADGNSSEAWYGFGDSLTGVDTEQSKIKGFICNWAGPNGQHTLIEKAQSQLIQRDETAFTFLPVAEGSSITYAPVNSCEYDSDSGGSFAYDRNLDSDLTDESADTNDVGDGELLEFDLSDIADNEFVAPLVPGVE